MSNYQLSPVHVKEVLQNAQAMQRANSGLAEDEILNHDMIEGSTNVLDLLKVLEGERREAVRQMAGLRTLITQDELRLERFERREQRLRELAFVVMQACNLRKVDLPEATYSIRPSPPKVIITAATIDELPEAYIRVKKEPDKVAIKAALQSGDKVTGAALSNQPDTLMIRTS